jgi:hypothetical protein
LKISRQSYSKDIQLFFILFLILLISRQPEAVSEDSKLAIGKRYFYSGEFEKADKALRQAIDKDPENAESYYFLGYTLSRILGKYHEEIPQTSFKNCEIISQPLEKAIELQPLYKGELYLLNPRDKLMSEWSCLALRYMSEDRIDQIKMAFGQAKKRGGFNQAVSEFMYNMLLSCPEKAILVTAGDMDTFYGLYLQIMENMRTDVTIVNIHLLRSLWYIRMVMKEHLWQTDGVKFNLSENDLVNLERFQNKFRGPFELSIPKYCVNKTGKNNVSMHVTPIVERNSSKKPPLNELVLSKMVEANPMRPICFASTVSGFKIDYHFEINNKKVTIDSIIEFNGLFNQLTFCKDISENNIEKLRKLFINDFKFEAIPDSDEINSFKPINFYILCISQIAKKLEKDEGEQSARDILAWFVKKVPGIRYLDNHKLRNFLLNSSGKATD